MLEFMMKYRRSVMIFIFVFVGIPMALMVPGTGGMGGDDAMSGRLPIVEVGDTVVTSAEFLDLYNRYTDMRRTQGQPIDAVSMMADGTVDQIVEQLIQDAVLQRGASKNPVIPDREFLAERLKEYSDFQDPQTGEFQPALYNQWVQGTTRAGVSWDAIYEQVAQDVKRESYLSLIEASAFVDEANVHEVFVRSKQKVRAKYLQIAPDTTRTEEQLREHFEENDYETLEGRTIDFVTFSLTPPLPPEVDEVISRARGGEDFAALVEEYSVGADKYDGGDMGWIEVTEDPTPQQEAIFALEVGEVSEPVESFTEIHIYKVEDERIREEDDTLEVHARRIVFRPSLSAEAKTAIENEAKAFLENVQAADGDLRGAASEAGLTVETSGAFDSSTTEIEGIHQNDVFAIRRNVLPLSEGEVTSTIVTGMKNLYVAKVASILEPRPMTFEEAREDVERDAENAYKQTEEYLNLRSEYANAIQAEAESLADIATVVPELADQEIKESPEFGPGDMLFNEGLFWNPQEAFALVVDAQPGTAVGPLTDFQGEQYMLELVEVIQPDEEQLQTEWQEIRDEMLTNARDRANMERRLDYLQYMSDRAQNVDGIVMRHDDAIRAVLGTDDATQFMPEVDDEAILEELSVEGESVTDVVVDTETEGAGAAEGATEDVAPDAETAVSDEQPDQQ